MDNKPDDLEPDTTGFDFYIDAFRELDTCRSSGLDIGAIPFTAIAEYFRIYELSECCDFDEFSYVIRRMDNAFVSMVHSNRKTEGKKNNASPANKKNSNKG